MNRRVFLRQCIGGALAGVSGGGLCAGAAVAEGFEGAVVTQLRDQGYSGIQVERTLLGRVRIVGERKGGTREIILNPRTGEILRDVLLTEDGEVEPQISGGSGTGEGSAGDDGSDDSGSGDDGSGDDGSGDGGSGDSGSDGSGHGGDGHDNGGDGED